MSNAIIRTALIQHCDHGDVGNNLDYIAGEIGAAAARGARLVLLQELHNHAYFCQT
jgi:N-carbamoylputrescine amidase